MSPDPPATEGLTAPFIDGESCGSVAETVIDVIDPSNGQRCFSLPAGCEGDVDRAVGAARAASEDGRWTELPPSARKNVLHRFADLVAADATTLDVLDAGEMGKPISTQVLSATAAANLLRFCAESVDKMMGDVLTSDPHSLVVQRRVPRGVVAAVTSWNFPTYVAMLKVAPALAAGNCVVLKPSEMASRSSVRLAQLAMRAGMPPGVLNVVLGLGTTVGRALGLHCDVDMLTFTGSTTVGKLMHEYAAQSNLKVVKAECGGKSPQIVFADGVDLDAASNSIAQLLLTNQGQICSVGSRLLVQREIASEIIERIAARAKQIVMGNALDSKTTFGPLASARQCARVMQYIETAPAEGAKCVAGGRRALLDSGGHFVEPTIFSEVPPGARIAQEEIFGPVLSVIPFADEPEAIRIANGTSYGLSAYVWTANLSTGMRMAKAIRSSVRINAAVPQGEGPGFAYSNEPARQSGVGIEGGLPGIESYMRRQTVWFNYA
jgi:acyl-CoA reductase-like NAD-dependent aldehyde dehydrogenase